ncbi:MAG: anaerobic glycerol-3-phosphate dehydrogenase subunit A [Desulfovibrionaceae bacterium]|nr:anaerobic glycerol-3-phosphate dehydrogenase subunit A [Desulfovibrionaceae bacterium]
MSKPQSLETKVVIIGGGATGMGTLRDLSMRGIPAILCEQGGIAYGTSSRFHGLLHSGARYAVNDTESARECIEENQILRQIGRQCVETTEGFFVLLPEDDLNYVDKWVEACQKAKIETQEIPVEEALKLEPELSKEVLKVFKVPDSCVDGFRLVLHNAMSAKRYGGQVLQYHKILEINQTNGAIEGVKVQNTLTKENFEIKCECVVNASGSWSGQMAKLAGIEVPVSPDRGTLLVFNHRLSNRVINRLHPGFDGVLFVPHGYITILGTTSVATQDPADTKPTLEEVLKLLEIGQPVFPNLYNYRILRAFAGTRPLYTPGGASGRAASRNFQVFDHAKDGLKGFFSIFGGKFTTYRLMAEKVSDAVAKFCHNTTPCRTHLEPMVEMPSKETLKAYTKYFPLSDLSLMADRLGDEITPVLERAKALKLERNPLLCECEMVSFAEIEHIAKDKDTHSLNDIRLRTRLGMGTCQGTFCALRTMNALYEKDNKFMTNPLQEIERFLQERWKGAQLTPWGTQAQEMLLTRDIYAGVLGLDGEAHAGNQ